MEKQVKKYPEPERLKGFISPQGDEYQWCAECPKSSEKFRGYSKENGPSSFNGIKWAIDNGYTPIWKNA